MLGLESSFKGESNSTFGCACELSRVWVILLCGSKAKWGVVWVEVAVIHQLFAVLLPYIDVSVMPLSSAPLLKPVNRSP